MDQLKETKLWKTLSILSIVIAGTIAVAYFFFKEKEEIDSKNLDLILNTHKNEVSQLGIEIKKLELELSNIKFNYTNEQEFCEREKNILQDKINELSANMVIEVNKDKLFKPWLGVWESEYSNSFSHSINFFLDSSNQLKGSYSFEGIKGTIDILDISGPILEGNWIQVKEGKYENEGTLTFILNESKDGFLGQYYRKSENYKKVRTWNGVKK